MKTTPLLVNFDVSQNNLFGTIPSELFQLAFGFSNNRTIRFRIQLQENVFQSCRTSDYGFFEAARTCSLRCLVAEEHYNLNNEQSFNSIAYLGECTSYVLVPDTVHFNQERSGKWKANPNFTNVSVLRMREILDFSKFPSLPYRKRLKPFLPFSCSGMTAVRN